MAVQLLPPLRLGLAGFGTVGSGLVRILAENRENTIARTGREIIISSVLVRDKNRARAVPLPEGAALTDDMEAFINTPDVDVIVEVIGGTTTAKELIQRALAAGKHVVTANKALLAETGNELFALAAEKNLHLGFEASICGGIPIVETMKHGLASSSLQGLMGILNGTSNYILSQMTSKGLSFEVALKAAQEKGYAEADPTFDIEGIDAAHKLALLIRLGWGVEFPFDKITIKGISQVLPEDIEYARAFGYRIKLIAYAKNHPEGLEASVSPTLVHETYLLSRVGDAYNAVRVHGDAVGSLFLHGKGAGDLPTGSSVAADIFAIARGSIPNNTGFCSLPKPAKLISNDAVTSPFYIRLSMKDRPGVLRDVAAIMAQHNISIAQAIQKKISVNDQPDTDECVPFTIMTHDARVSDVEKALAALEYIPTIQQKPVSYRVMAKNLS
jgi:Homoserine dehydrogenase